MALLELTGVNAAYGPIAALHGVSLSVDTGAIVALLGANGAGTVSYTHLTLPTICSV